MKNILLMLIALVLVFGCRTSQPCIENTPGMCAAKGAAVDYTDSIYNPKPVREKVLWADSWLYAEAPELEVEEWFTAEPDRKGKYILLEFWGTYCPPCRKMVPILNDWHKKYKDELVIIGISHEEDVEKVRAFSKEKVDYYSCIDTQARTKNKMNVTGVPHVVIIEPEHGCVIWEGFPLLEGFELKEETIKRILEVGRKLDPAQ